MTTIRPGGSGREGQASPFIRTITSPRAGLVLTSATAPPSDWPANDGSAEGNLGHALGWTCEIRRSSIVVLNPLGEGLLKTALPELSVEWLTHVRQDGSCAVYLTPPVADAGFAELTISTAANSGVLTAATVRTAIAEDYGRSKPVGRNQPCPCGSGKKFKHCHG